METILLHVEEDFIYIRSDDAGFGQLTGTKLDRNMGNGSNEYNSEQHASYGLIESQHPTNHSCFLWW